MKKKISVLFICFIVSSLSYSQCNDDCKKNNILFDISTDVLKNSIVSLVNSNDFEDLKKAYEKIKDVAMGDGILYMDTLHVGVGCFYYYYGYAKLIAKSRKDKRLANYLFSKMGAGLDSLQEIRKARVAILNSDTIISLYKENYCIEKQKKINGRKGNMLQIYENDIKEIQRVLIKNTDTLVIERPILKIIEFTTIPLNPKIGDTISFCVKIKNKRKKELKNPIQLNLFPNTSDKGNIKTSPDINNILPNSTNTIWFTYQYNQAGTFQTAVELTAESVGGNIDSKSTNVTIRNDKGTTEPQSKIVGVYLNQNGEVSIFPPKTIYGSPPCMVLNREFKVGKFNTSASIEIDSLALKETLAPFINQRKNILNTLNIEITGYADKTTFSSKGKVPTFLGIIKDEPYFSLNDTMDKYMTLGTFFNKNEQLAFIRAYILKKKILEWFGPDLNPNQIMLKTQRKFDKNNSSRGATIQICSDEFTENDMTQLYDKAMAEIGGEGEPIPESKNPVADTSTGTNETPNGGPDPKEEIKPVDLEVEEEVIIEGLKKKELKVGDTIRIEQIQFKAKKAIITKKSYPILDEIFNFLKKYPDVVVEIGGHTNNLPTHKICDKRSKERAEAVKEYLMKKGIAIERIITKGYGKRNPIASNKTLAGRKKNQRVELKILAIDNR